MLTLLCSVMTWADETTHAMSSYSNKVITDDQKDKWNLNATGTIGSSNAFPANMIPGNNSKRGVSINSASAAIKITSESSYSGITKLVVYASANGGTTGSVSVKVGSTAMTAPADASLPSGSNNKTFEFTSTTPLTGKIEITLPYTSSKTVWFGGVVITTSSGSDTPATEQFSYTLETVGQGTVVFKDANNNTIEPNQKVDSGTKISPTFTPAAGYEFTSWEYYTTAGAWSKLTGNDFTISKDVQFRVTFTAVGGDDPTPGEGNSETYTFSSFTQGNDVTLESTNYTVTLHKNTGSNAPQWNGNSNEARVYAKGSVVVTSEKNIVKIVYDYVLNAGGKNNVTPTIDGVSGANDAGTWDATTKTWTGKDNTVTLSTSGSAGNLGFKSITVYFEEESTPETPSITISAAGVATYYNSTYSYKMPKGLTGYWVSAAYGEDGIGLLELTDSYPADVVVPAGEALIIKGAAGTYELEAGTTDYKPYGDNRLKGTDEAATTTGGDVYYKLAVDPESGLGFYWGAENGTAFTNGAHKAYLALTSEEAGVSGAKGFVLNFDDATAISTVKTSVNANVAYNLAGQRVNANTKGIVIMNGKKYLNK